MPNIRLKVNHEGQYQVDVYLEDGRDMHAVGKEPWDALVELALFWQVQGHMSDNERLARTLLDTRPSSEDR